MPENETLVFPEPRAVRLEERERPEPGPDELLIETTRSVVSTGTELTIMSGDYPEGGRWDAYGQYPFDTGYSNVGEVIEVGENVADERLGGTVATRSPHTRYHAVAADDAVRVPEGIPDAEAAFFALAAIAMNGVRRGRVEWGETAALYGCGLVGQLAARFCRVAGARPVVGFDLAPERLAQLPDGPAVVGADPEADDPVDVVESATGGRLADVVFEVTGLGSVVPGEFAVLREPLGRLVVLSSPRGETTLDLHDHVNGPSYEIIGAHEGSHPPAETPHTPWTHERHHALFFDLVADGELDVGSLISHRVPSGEAPAFYESLLADRSDAMGVVIEW